MSEREVSYYNPETYMLTIILPGETGKIGDKGYTRETRYVTIDIFHKKMKASDISFVDPAAKWVNMLQDEFVGVMQKYLPDVRIH